MFLSWLSFFPFTNLLVRFTYEDPNQPDQRFALLPTFLNTDNNSVEFIAVSQGKVIKGICGYVRNQLLKYILIILWSHVPSNSLLQLWL